MEVGTGTTPLHLQNAYDWGGVFTLAPVIGESIPPNAQRLAKITGIAC